MSVENIYVPLIVDDYDRAIQFYCDVLGLFSVEQNCVLPGGHREVVLCHATHPFSLLLDLATSGEMKKIMGKQAGEQDRAFLVLPVADCAEAFSALKERGVEFDENRIIDLPWGRQATLRDPFGNRVCLSETCNH